ncbi:hypothetical protein niasHT_005209 [Heterodera trifolii]|uniref:Uncharacterized protein n=1 Tax=Heterodera trifolii TaxID=157864 RepID=A0ABD2LRU9_9BILA
MSSVRSISSTARAGNVLVLLDLYASGFASSNTSPTIPMLTSRTISFPLNFWLAMLLVVASISGTMLIILLMNAFAHRLDITVHKNGLAVIIEAFLEWLYGFNNFRVAFLFMLLHDAPITLANFFLLGACRCGGPNVLSWPLLLSALAIALSLCWRLILLRFAYARLVFRRPSPDPNSAFPSRSHSFRQQFAADQCTASQNEVNSQLDELWAIRRARAIVYGEKRGKCWEGTAGETLYLGEEGARGAGRSMGQCCGFWSSWVLLKGFDMFCALFRRLLCLLLSLFLCSVCLSVCCVPCLHHYLYSPNSFSHRHKCAKTFVRHFSLLFHYVIFGFSLCFSALLILLNVVLIFSTQLVGPNQWPPEISRLCISVSPHRRIVRPLFLPQSTLFSSFLLPPKQMNNGTAADLRWHSLVQCKPIWDLPHQQTLVDKWAPGLSRKNPSPWQSRFPLQDGRVLAVSTHFVSDHSEEQSPRHTLFYDFALLTVGADNSSKTTKCARQRFSGWFFANARNVLGFPYFWACSPSISIRKGTLINCQSLTKH